MLKMARGGDCADYLAANPDVFMADLERLVLVAPLLQEVVSPPVPSGNFQTEWQGSIADGRQAEWPAEQAQKAVVAAPQAKTNESAWPEPEPIEQQLRPVKPLPKNLVPDAFRDWWEDISYRMNCPVDYIGISSVIAVAAVIGAGCAMHPKEHDDTFVVVPNQFGGIVGRPSTLKSPVMQEGKKPLARLEETARQEYDEAMKAYAIKAEIYRAEKEALMSSLKAAVKGKSQKDQAQIKRELETLQEPQPPVLKRYSSNDSTIEKMGELMRENPRGLLLVRDELAGFLATMEKEGHEQDRTFTMESWNGTGSYTVDRIGRGTIHVDNLCMSILGGIQPDKLTGYLYQAMRAFGNDGFLQRFQLLVYPDEAATWELRDKRPDKAASNRAFEIFRKLATMNFIDHGAVQGDDDRFPYFQFDAAGQKCFNEWLGNLELAKLRNNDDAPIVQEHLAKYRSLMPSLALIFHLIEVADGRAEGPVSLKAAECAVAWCEYLESHARRIYGMVLDIDRLVAAKLAGKIIKGQVEDGFTVRDIYRKNWHLLNDRDVIQAAISELVDAYWLRPQDTASGYQQRGKTQYIINPKVKRGNA